MSAHIRRRARDLAGSIREVEGRVLEVGGYMVTVPANAQADGLPLVVCPCKAGREGQPCSHALAAYRYANDHPARR